MKVYLLNPQNLVIQPENVEEVKALSVWIAHNACGNGDIIVDYSVSPAIGVVPGSTMATDEYWTGYFETRDKAP